MTVLTEWECNHCEKKFGQKEGCIVCGICEQCMDKLDWDCTNE